MGYEGVGVDRVLIMSHSLPGCEGFDGDGVGGFSGGEHGEEGWALLALGADDGYVAGVGVGSEEDVFVG